MYHNFFLMPCIIISFVKCLNIWFLQKIHTRRAVQLPREAVEFLSLEAFKSWLNKAMTDLIQERH